MSHMSRIKIRVARAIDRVAARFYEGPTPPARLAEQARLFLLSRPDATSLDWELFASELAASAYRDGFTRGVEALLRRREPESFPLDDAADRERHEWALQEQSEAMARHLDGDGEGDPLAGVPPHERAAAFDEIGRALGGYRVVLVASDAEASSRP